ncbi:MAG: 50S ribosomal protein L6 [Puniceicoccales bacterium]|jgi:large subunit ribosomal protein L6|nr:50S ribosomal protein L6 [Puniceicoccales bacterium]
MSRIGKLPIEIPGSVTVTLDDNVVIVNGPCGKLRKKFDPSVIISISDGIISVSRRDNSDPHSAAMYGTTRSIINAMVAGVQKCFSKNLEINGVGFKAIISGNLLDLSLGYSHPIRYKIPDGIKIVVQENTKILVEGPDKHMVGQVAADIKHFYPVEPYKGKGVRIVGEYVRRKEGKKAS